MEDLQFNAAFLLREKTIMLGHMPRAIALASLFALGACQTSGLPTASTSSALLASGFIETSVSNIQFSSIASVNKIYICPQSRCGALTVIVYGFGIAPNSNPVSVEEQIRNRVVSDAKLKDVLRIASRSQPDQMNVTEAKQFSNSQNVGFTFSGNVAAKTKGKVLFFGRAIVRGNAFDISVALSDNASVARRTAALIAKD